MTAVLREAGPGVTVVRLNRPEVLNAINVALLEGLTAALRASQRDRAIVVEGAGRAFCAGEDLKETLAPRTGAAEELRRSFELLQDVTRLCTRAEGPVVAAVHGYAVGGGAEIALAADIVVAGEQARFRFPEVGLGHAVTGGITVRLPAIVGLLKAKELLLGGRWVAAEEALALGLVNEIADDPAARARELAAELGGHPRRSLTATKRALELGAVPHQEHALHHEVDAASWCFAEPG